MLKFGFKVAMTSLSWLLLIQPARGDDSFIPFFIHHSDSQGSVESSSLCRDSFLDCFVNSTPEDGSGFQPEGIWNLEFKNVSFGLTAYKTDFGPQFGISKKGDNFASTQYFPDRAQELNHLNSLQFALVNTTL